MSDVTLLLSVIKRGDTLAANQLLPVVYDELRKLAIKMSDEQDWQCQYQFDAQHTAPRAHRRRTTVGFGAAFIGPPAPVLDALHVAGPVDRP